MIQMRQRWRAKWVPEKTVRCGEVEQNRRPGGLKLKEREALRV